MFETQQSKILSKFSTIFKRSLLSHPPFLPLFLLLHHFLPPPLLSSLHRIHSPLIIHPFFPSLTAASSPLCLILVVSMWTKSYFWILSFFFFFFLFWIPPRVSSSSSSSFSSTDAFLYLKCRQLPSITCGGIKGFRMRSDPGRRLLGVIISTWFCDETHSGHERLGSNLQCVAAHPEQTTVKCTRQ